MLNWEPPLDGRREYDKAERIIIENKLISAWPTLFPEERLIMIAFLKNALGLKNFELTILENILDKKTHNNDDLSLLKKLMIRIKRSSIIYSMREMQTETGSANSIPSNLQKIISDVIKQIKKN